MRLESPAGCRWNRWPNHVEYAIGHGFDHLFAHALFYWTPDPFVRVELRSVRRQKEQGDFAIELGEQLFDLLRPVNPMPVDDECQIRIAIPDSNAIRGGTMKMFKCMANPR